EVRAVISFVVVAVTVVLQLTIVNRIAFPGGAGPDLVLLVVAALALAGGPMAGVLTGFLAGLALDVAPPGSHLVGQNALVFCLVGYACGLLADDASGDAEQGHTALFEIVVVAAGAVCGEALLALLGVMLSDPQVTWPAITNVLPAAVAYNVLLCPFVLYAVAAALRLGGARGESRRAGWSPSQARTPAPGASQGAIRQLAGGNAPRLRLSERDKGPGSIGGLRGPGAVRPTARREPQLKLGRPGQRSPAGLGAAFAPAGLGAGTARVRFGGRRHEGVLGGSLLGGSRSAGRGGSARLGSAGLGSSRLGSSRLGSSRLGISRFGGSSMGRSLLGGSVFSRTSSSPLSRPAVFGRSAPLGLASPLRHRGNLAGGGLTGHAPRFSRGSPLTRVTSALRRSGGPKSPGRGWLRGVSSRGAFSRRGSLGSGSLGSASMSRRAFGGRRIGRNLASRSAAGRSLAGGNLGRRGLGHTGSPRLRMPRPKSRRRWRSGGYR
ncbi:MAG TPA: rod shape-determining protein MreD, partial [Streptosporangiaceae bacterium]|nr:rod shape-determining protein MreD [Streptosporangiaceae bacterium]